MGEDMMTIMDHNDITIHEYGKRHYILLSINSLTSLNKKVEYLNKIEEYIKNCESVQPIKVKYNTSYIDDKIFANFLGEKNLKLAKYIESFNIIFSSKTFEISSYFYSDIDEYKIINFLKSYGILLVKDPDNINSFITTLSMFGFNVAITSSTKDSEYVTHYLEMGEHVANFEQMAYDGLFHIKKELEPILMYLTGQENNSDIVCKVFQKYRNIDEVREHYKEKFKDNMFYMFVENIFPTIFTKNFKNAVFYKAFKTWFYAKDENDPVLVKRY